MESKKYIGLDVHQASISAAVRNEARKLAINSVIETNAGTWLLTTLRRIRDGVIGVDSLWAVKLLKAAAGTGWSVHEAVNHDLSEVFCIVEPETRAIAASSIMRAITGASERTCSRKVLVSRDGTETLVEETTAAITNTTGFMIGVDLVFHEANSPYS
jgi:hypothetical protein